MLESLTLNLICQLRDVQTQEMLSTIYETIRNVRDNYKTQIQDKYVQNYPHFPYHSFEHDSDDQHSLLS